MKAATDNAKAGAEFPTCRLYLMTSAHFIFPAPFEVVGGVPRSTGNALTQREEKRQPRPMPGLAPSLGKFLKLGEIDAPRGEPRA
jgi:hypothetical protein